MSTAMPLSGTLTDFHSVCRCGRRISAEGLSHRLPLSGEWTHDGTGTADCASAERWLTGGREAASQRLAEMAAASRAMMRATADLSTGQVVLVHEETRDEYAQRQAEFEAELAAAQREGAS